MKKYLLSIAIVLMALFSYGQTTCTPTFTLTHSPRNNDIFRCTANINYVPSTYNIHTVIDWGDGTVTAKREHNYSTPGTYSVKVTKTIIDSTTNIIYCVDSATDSISLAYDSCMTTVTAVVDPLNNGKVTYTANTPLNGTYHRYHWNFNDGTTPTYTFSSNQGYQTVTHTYANTGEHRLILTASKSSCSYANYNNTFVINGCGTTNINLPSITGGFVQFNSSSTNIPNSTQSYAWDFGDGTTGTGKSPSHMYANGSFNVTLVTSWHDNQNQLICKDTATRTIYSNGSDVQGFIKIDSTKLSISPTYKVWLIKYDSSTNTLSAVDSLTINNTYNNNWFYYKFLKVYPGIYRVKAAITNGPTSGTGYVPTYHDSALLWSNAGTFNPNSGLKNIYLKQGTVTNGPGFVAGNVTQGANKGTANGIADMPVYLLGANNELISYATTDGGGNFSFSNIPIGTYKVHPEEMNYNTIDALITISANSKSANVHFERTHANKTISPDLLSISNTNKIDNNLAIFPNPASKTVSVKWTGKDVANIILTDISGKQVMSSNVASKSTKQLDISRLSNGLYFITIESEGLKTTQKLLIQ